MEQELSFIKERLDNIERIQLLILEKLNDITKSTENMDTHINFIEKTYDTVKAPLSYIKTNVERLMGISNTPTLPELE
jgi:hypothetical protein